ncbi:hypothetical protein MLD38_024916 [Melastoma candidum]|uniref:Uncharacterized protein n=1 Tax=Melastoma candidum TaxID=119954 RepID=A0ACB9NVD2_9MYRT|nr:hypothetical protein MLD38_024916 [Melastoma candidum]
MEWIRGPVIGRGSSSTVSLSFSPSSGQVLAVKSADLSCSSSLQKEAGLLSSLTSPYIVEYRGCGVTGDHGGPTYNLFMEYAPRGTLRDLIRARGGRLEEPEVREIARGILLGLEYIHGKGIAHCDIKSQNILIAEGGIKIADFGCAKLGECAAAFAGTPAYMSPEAARREEQGYVSDVWSVGCTAVEMATGSPPWMDTDSPVSALYRIGYSGEVPEPPRWFTQEARDFIRRCLIWDPKERPSAKKLLRHPFFYQSPGPSEAAESSRDKDAVDGDSPNGVLELRLWESLESVDAEVTWPNLASRNAGERMGQLIDGCSRYPILGQTEWGSGGDEWLTVRASEDEEADDDRDNRDNEPPESALFFGEEELDLSVLSLDNVAIRASCEGDDDVGITEEVTVITNGNKEDCLVHKESSFEEDDSVLNQLLALTTNFHPVGQLLLTSLKTRS